jgi:SAM-dependent methyltransferase
MLQILRFNADQYVLAGVFIIVAILLVVVISLPLAVKWVIGLGAVCAFYWSVASIIVSYVVYDRSTLTSWRWLSSQLPRHLWNRGRWINIHAGFDDTTWHLREMLPQPPVSVVDLYNEKLMTERSIAVARKASQRDPATVNASPDCLPLGDRSVDVVFLLMAAHEIRDREMRTRFFRELQRVLDVGGRVVLVEHLRDLRNFLAFGPGFLHFFPRHEWTQRARKAKFRVVSEVKNTPFVTLFVLEKEHESDGACTSCGNAAAVSCSA